MCFTHSHNDAKASIGLSTGRPGPHPILTLLEEAILGDSAPPHYRYTNAFYPLVPRLARRKRGPGRKRIVYVNQTANALRRRALADDMQDFGIRTVCGRAIDRSQNDGLGLR